MKIISGTLKALGPGILFAGAAIGVSHLVQSTRAGASYGFSLFLLVIVTNFLKYPFFEFANRYTAATGESVLKGYKDLGNFALISFLILSFISSFINISAIGLVTTGLAENLFHTGIPIVSLSGILVSLIVVILVVLLFGRGKISSLMGDVAKGIKSFKKGMATDITDESEPEPKNVSENNQDSKDKE